MYLHCVFTLKSHCVFILCVCTMYLHGVMALRIYLVPGSQAASQPGSQPGSQPTRQPAKQPASQPASHAATQQASPPLLIALLRCKMQLRGRLCKSKLSLRAAWFAQQSPDLLFFARHRTSKDTVTKLGASWVQCETSWTRVGTYRLLETMC